jgi:hypothetical protein
MARFRGAVEPPSPQSIRNRSLPAWISTAGRPRSAEGVLAAVPRKVTSNI